MPGVRILLLAMAALLLGQSGPAWAKAGKRPNILLIVADDIGYTDLGSYGSEIPTPNLDRLAARGVRFSDFHTGMTCSPTRAMLLSGVDHHLAGVGNMAGDISPNQKGKPGFEGYLNFQVAALPEVLKQAGYRTFMAGKWHLGGSDTTSPAGRGFDHSFSLIDGGAGHFANMMPMVGPGKATYRDGNRPVESLPGDFYSTRFYTDKLLEYLGAESGAEGQQPFFAYLAFTAPHWPIQAPEESLARFAGQYEDGYDTLFERRLAASKRLGLAPADAQGAARAPQGKAWDSLSPAERRYEARKMQAFAAMVSDLDIQVGRVLDWLEKTGQMDNTIIMFMSDNGYEGHDLRHGFTEAADYAKTFDNSLERIGKSDSYVWMGPDWGRASSAPFRLYKGYPTEGGTRVPFLVSYPGLKRSGLVETRGHVSDVMPTLLELAGIRHPGTRFAGRKVFAMSGKSMAPYLSGRAERIHAPDAPFAQELFGKRAIRIGRWKAIEMAAPYGSGRWELFDIAADPAERHDLAAQNPKRLRRMTAQWHRWAKRSNVIMPDWVTGY
jgi:arylsulfatase